VEGTRNASYCKKGESANTMVTAARLQESDISDFRIGKQAMTEDKWSQRIVANFKCN